MCNISTRECWSFGGKGEEMREKEERCDGGKDKGGAGVRWDERDALVILTI